MLELSQVIYGVRDLDAATQRIEALGLTVLDGGRHPGLGTANRIVPLGAAYLELLGVVDEAEARHNNYGTALVQSPDFAHSVDNSGDTSTNFEDTTV